MTRVVVIVALITVMTGMVFADSHLMFGTPEGDWAVRRNRLYQYDADASRAKAWVSVPQNGSMIYEFTMRYEGGIEDGHGGVGIHILSDTRPEGRSWGMGDSWLLWLNYDTVSAQPDIPKGLSAQLYKSTSNSDMELIDSVSLSSVEPIAAQYINSIVPVKLTYLSSQGRVLIADPRGKSAGWYIDLPDGRYETGQYAAVRTNGIRMSFSSSDIEL